MKVLVAAVAVCVVLQLAAAANWNYDDSTGHGPSEWATLYPTCGGTRQSPINIVDTTAVPMQGTSKLTLNNYDAIPPNPFTLINNGHSAQVAVNTNNVTIEGGGLKGTYILEQFHFHWGADATTGSEHLINSKQYPLEVHFVHHSAKYPDVSTAAASGDPEGVAVVGVLFEINDQTPSPEMEEIATHLTDVPYEDESESIPAFNLMHLLPQNQLGNFYRYYGSLTTPACNEVVVWTVFTTPITVTTTELNQFRSIHSNLLGEPDVILTHNYRPAQSLNGRTVYAGAGFQKK